MLSSTRLRHLLATLYGIPFVIIGINHFRNPEWFEPIVPEAIGSPRFWVLVSGVFEILLGLMVMIPRTRKYASIGFVAMLISIYWANLNMWINDIEIGNTRLSQFGHVVRAAIQFLLIIVALWLGKLPPFNKKGVPD
jgi:uncharacterized membrane protein